MYQAEVEILQLQNEIRILSNRCEDEQSFSTKLKIDLKASKILLQEQSQKREKAEEKVMILTGEVKCLEKLCAQYKGELKSIMSKTEQWRGDGVATLSQMQGDLMERTQQVRIIMRKGTTSCFAIKNCSTELKLSKY